nr:Wamide-gated sodium channel [Malacoceros fuliginosus]
MPLGHMMQMFAGGTTMHGVPKAIRSKSLTGRIFWSFICLAAASMFCLQFAQLLQKYYSYPKRVTIDIVPSPVPFPAISLCNMRNLDIIVLNNLNKIFKEAADPLNWGNYTSDPFINAYMSVVAKYYPMFVRPDINMHVFQTVLTRTLIATNIERDMLERAGVPFKEFVVTCRFGGHDCNRTKDFRQFFDSYYYNCFTYISPYTPQDHDSILAEGLENGWSTVVLTGAGMLDKNEEIRMIPGTHDRVSPMSSNEGVRVVIHPPDTEPYPHTEGFDVAPGYSVSFGVKARENIRIGPPHGNCSNSNPFGNESSAYRLISCQKKCLQKYIVSQCGCKEISIPGHDAMFPDLDYCTSDKDIPDHCRESSDDDCVNALFKVYHRFLCVRNASKHMTTNASATRECGCYPPCHESNYDITYSLSKWPAESFDGEEAYIDIFETENYPGRFMEPEDAQKFDLYANYFDASNRRTAMKDFARLNVYIADSNVLKTEESEEYTQSQLLSDIGGQLGLWVGISVITLAEVLELIVDVVKWVVLSHGPCSQGRTFSKDPEIGEQERGLNGESKSKSRNSKSSRNSKRSNGKNKKRQMNGTIPLTATTVYEEENEYQEPVI